MDKLILERMEFYGYHGVFPEEQRLGQRFIVDLIAHVDLNLAGQSDQLEDTINYAEIVERTRQIVQGEPFQLIEALAERIASTMLDTYTRINEITVRVTKPHPPFDIHFAGITVEIHRKRV